MKISNFSMKISSKFNVEKEIILFWRKKNSFCESANVIYERYQVDVLDHVIPDVELMIFLFERSDCIRHIWK